MSPFKARTGQREFEKGVRKHRLCACVARRQYGKTTLVSRISLRKMMKRPGHTVIFGSVKLDLGREIVRKESETIHKTLQQLSREVAEKGAQFDCVDTIKQRPVLDLKADDFADLYEASRLEFRLYHSKTVYSRTKVVALTPEAVGETGDLILDEVGRVRNFRAVWEAMKPFVASNPEFRCILTTTPPPDDGHFSYELLCPPIGEEFPISKTGNWYRSELGVNVLRISAWDAYADGVPLYDDDSGEPISPEESRKKDPDKDAWDRNYGVKFVLGGTSACGLLQLETAQRRGLDKCAFCRIETDSDFDAAMEFLAAHLGHGKIGIGFDIATTTSGTSNPSALAICEEQGNEYIFPLIATWKTAQPGVTRERLRRVLQVIAARQKGGRARRLDVDATNEKYFATDLRDELAADIPVELVIGSETVELPGGEKITVKQKTCSDLVATLDDNQLTLPAHRYIREDWRLPKKEKGLFVCPVDTDGKHGDTFDGARLALRAVRGSGPVEATAVPISKVSQSFSPSWNHSSRSL